VEFVVDLRDRAVRIGEAPDLALLEGFFFLERTDIVLRRAELARERKVAADDARVLRADDRNERERDACDAGAPEGTQGGTAPGAPAAFARTSHVAPIRLNFA
jgi:hypothetical protein